MDHFDGFERGKVKFASKMAARRSFLPGKSAESGWTQLSQQYVNADLRLFTRISKKILRRFTDKCFVFWITCRRSM